MSNEMDDISFRANKRLPIHSWFGYVTGYDAKFVRSVIDEYLGDQSDATVFDPYSGSGTTLVEAIDSGRDAIGAEINPFMAFVTRNKTSWNTYPDNINTRARAFIDETKPQVLTAFPNETLDSYGDNAVADVKIKSMSEVPGLANIENWYTDEVLEQLRILKGNIKQIEDEGFKSLCLLAFASILVDVSNGGYDPSLGYRRDSDGNIIENQVNCAQAFEEKLTQLVSDVNDKVLNRDEPHGDALVLNSDGEEYPGLRDECVDLLVTSPPYCNNMNYIRQTRPHLYWLDYWADRSRRKFEDNMMGSYWQIVRKEEVEIKYPTETLEEVTNEIRNQEPEREELGGPGWARYVTRYFNDTGNALQQHYRLLTPDSYAVYVVGNSVIKGVNTPVGDILAEMVDEHFDFEVVDSPVHSTDRRKASSLRTEDLEDIVVTINKPAE
jgi:SAM-dependent methyltransferase